MEHTCAAIDWTSLPDIYNRTRKLLFGAQERMQRVESMPLNGALTVKSEGQASGLQEINQIMDDISKIDSCCHNMDKLSRSMPTKAQRDLWRSKVQQIEEHVDSLRKCIATRHKRLKEAEERACLLRNTNGQSAIALKIFDEEAQSMCYVQNSKMMLQDSLSMGSSILLSYSQQRERLKSAQRKALDVLNTLGLSGSVLRLVERRNRVDRWIKYFGMITTLILLLLFGFWIS